MLLAALAGATVLILAVTIACAAYIDGSIEELRESLHSLERKADDTLADLTALTAQVSQNTTVEESAVTLINGLAALIKAAGTDPVALQALQTQLAQSATDLGNAVTANTPAAPPTTTQTGTGP